MPTKSALHRQIELMIVELYALLNLRSSEEISSDFFRQIIQIGASAMEYNHKIADLKNRRKDNNQPEA